MRARSERRTEPVVRALAGAGHIGLDRHLEGCRSPRRRSTPAPGSSTTSPPSAGIPELAGLCADRGCDVVLMHMLGSPRTMQDDPRYDDVVDDVKGFLSERIESALEAGVAEERIWVDPGIGFGKTLEHNLELLRRLGELRELGRPIIVGTSRKRFIGAITGRDANERIGGTVASNVLALANGADAFRVHDVAEVREALDVTEALTRRRDWGVDERFETESRETPA